MVRSAVAIRFPIRFDPVYRAVSSALLISPSDSYLEVDAGEVALRMAFAFRTRFALTAVKAAVPSHERPWSRGVHGFGGRWLVNGSGEGILVIDLEPAQRAFVLGFPIVLRQLRVSVEDPV